MKDKLKIRLIITGGLAICIALVFMISNEMKPEPVVDDPLPQTTEEPTDIIITEPTENTEKEEIIVPEIEIEPTLAPTEKADDVGTEQTIQPDPEPKPEITEEQKTDSTQTPSGESVEVPTVENPTPPQTQVPETPPTPTEPSNPSGGLPGFDNSEIIQGGENEVIVGESDGDINKQVGIMG